MTVLISKPAINLREELASLRNQGGLPKEDKLYLDNLVDNGTFDNDVSGWTVGGTGATLTYSSGQAILSRNGTSAIALQYITTVVGKHYTFSCSLIATSGAARLGLQAGSVTNTSSNYIGTHSISFTATSTTTTLTLHTYNTVSGTLTLDNVSVQEVGENLVTNGTFDTDSGWTKGTGWTISGGTASCDGTDATSLNTINQPLVIGKEYAISFDITAYTSGAVRLLGASLYSISGNAVSTVTATFVATNTYLKFYSSAFTGSIDNITVTEGNHQVIQSIPHGYDVKDVYIDGDLAREGEAYDYEVKTDGINQWLKPTVEPTATTETVVIGVRK